MHARLYRYQKDNSRPPPTLRPPNQVVLTFLGLLSDGCPTLKDRSDSFSCQRYIQKEKKIARTGADEAISP